MQRLMTMAEVIVVIAIVLAVAAWLILRLPSFGGQFKEERLERMQQSRQFHGGRFENTPPYVSSMSVLRELRDYFGDQVREPGFEVPVLKMSADDLARPAAPGLRTWWLGHASVLIELDGVRIWSAGKSPRPRSMKWTGGRTTASRTSPSIAHPRATTRDAPA